MSENQELDFASLAAEVDAAEVEAAVEVAEEAVAAEPADDVVAEEAVESAEAEAAEAEAEEAPADPREAEREDLRERSRYSDWYVIHSYAGFEKRVKANLENRIKTMNMEDYIFEVQVPTEEVVEIKAGVRKLVQRNKYPGYVLVRMDLSNDEVWGVVRHTPGVTGFVGHGHNPSELPIEEVVDMLVPKGSGPVGGPVTTGGVTKDKPVVETDFAVGDAVIITEGPFATLQATIAELNLESQKVFGLVEIFGRETRVELSFNQIRRND